MKNSRRANASNRFDDLLRSGLAHHSSGRLDQAAEKYEAALRLRPGHADALHYLGVVAHQRGDHDKAVELIERAVSVRGDVAQMFCNLAEAQRSKGRPADAETSCRRALMLRTEYPEAQLNLAVALYEQKRFAESEIAARAALRLRADFPAASLALADALRAQQSYEDAEQAYRQLLATKPNQSAAMANLGWMLVQAGRMDEGLEFCRRAVAEASDDLLPLQNLGRVLLEYGRLDEAMEVLERALERAPNAPQVSLLIGIAWDELGEIVEARNWLSRALQLDENLHEARVRIATLEADLDNHQGALDILQAVLAIEPNRVDALVAKAKARLSLGDVDGAVADHRAAIDLLPRAAFLHAALGGTLASAGDIAGAVVCQRAAIALDEHCVPAYAGLLTTLRHKTSDSECAAAIGLLGAPWMTDKRRANLHFGLAAYFDGKSDWTAAAEHMVEANALRLATEERRHRHYKPDQYASFVDKIIDTFTPALFDRLQGLGSQSERPVFVVGMPRSGTTLTEQILASHPDAFGAGERPFAQRSLAILPHIMANAPSEDPLDCLHAVDRSTLQAAAAWHLDQLAALDGGNTVRIVDKMPDNYSLLGWLAILFPHARFIYCRRDPRDIALSCWITNFSSIRWANDLDHLAQRLQQHRRLTAHWQHVLPVPLLEVDYEAVVADQEAQSRRLIDWVGLDWNERCLNFFQTERLVRTASLAQVREPIYKRSVARWQHYQAMLAPLVQHLAQ